MVFLPKLVGWPFVQDFKSFFILVRFVDLTCSSKLVWVIIRIWAHDLHEKCAPMSMV